MKFVFQIPVILVQGPFLLLEIFHVPCSSGNGGVHRVDVFQDFEDTASKIVSEHDRLAIGTIGRHELPNAGVDGDDGFFGDLQTPFHLDLRFYGDEEEVISFGVSMYGTFAVRGLIEGKFAVIPNFP